MTITKKLMSASCAAAIALSMCAPVMAFADVLEFDEGAKTASTDVQMHVDVKPSNINVNVPAVPDPTPTDPTDPSQVVVDSAYYNATTIVFNADGTTKSAELPVMNTGAGSIILASVDVTQDGGWTLENWNADNVSYETPNLKHFGMKVNNTGLADETPDGKFTVALDRADYTITSGNQKTIKFDSDKANRPMYTTDWEDLGGNDHVIQNAFKATLHFELPAQSQ